MLQELGQFKKSREKLTALSGTPQVKRQLHLQADMEKILDRQTAFEMSKSGKNAVDNYLRALSLVSTQVPEFTPELSSIAWGKKKIVPAERQNIQNLVTPYEPVFAELEKAVAKDYCYFTYCFVCGDQPPNFGTYLAVVKLWMLQGQLFAYEGKLKESAIIFKNVVRIGQQFEQGFLIQYLVAYGFRRFGMDGINSLLAMPLKEPELIVIRDAVIELERKDKPFDLMELKKSDVGGEQPDKFEPVIPRGKYPRMQLAIAKVAVAMKLYQLKENKSPNKLVELIPSYQPEIPKDIFGTGPLRGIKTPSEFTIYSFGPNKKDDSGKILYDPTNGTFSSGDIILQIR